MTTDQPLSMQNLSPKAQTVIQSKIVSDQMRLSGWIDLFRELSAFDAKVDERYAYVKSRAIKATIIAAVGAFLSIFAIAFSEGNTIVMGICAAIVLIFACAAIYYWIKAAGLKKINLDNTFRETLLPVLEALTNDIPAKSKLKLTMNLDDPSQKKYKLSEKKLPPGKNKKLIERVYQIHCCNARIPLFNETMLMLDIIKAPASYDRYYKNPRGKHKHKRKWKMLTTVTAGLMPAKAAFHVSQPEFDRMAGREKVKLAEKTAGQLCKLTRKIKSKSDSGVPEETIAPEMVIEMFMKLCQMLTRAA